MSRALIIVLSFIVAFVIGTASAGYAITHWLSLGGLKNGPWLRLNMPWQTGSDPYSKALEHVSGHLPLGSAEGQIFVASKDSDGQQLNANCSYRIFGNIPSVRLFTIRAAAAGGNLSGTAAGLVNALHSDQMLFTSNQFIINAAPTAQPDNWLPLKVSGPFQLILTYYDVAVINDDTGNAAHLPQISKQGCAS